jgi:hypothetical protein
LNKEDIAEVYYFDEDFEMIPGKEGAAVVKFVLKDGKTIWAAPVRDDRPAESMMTD